MDDFELFDLTPSKAEIEDAYGVLGDMYKNFKT